MARTRISTTVSSELLEDARNARAAKNDAELIDAALAALLDKFRAAEIEELYRVGYGTQPIDEQDEWGDLAAFRAASAKA